MKKRLYIILNITKYGTDILNKKNKNKIRHSRHPPCDEHGVCVVESQSSIKHMHSHVKYLLMLLQQNLKRDSLFCIPQRRCCLKMMPLTQSDKSRIKNTDCQTQAIQHFSLESFTEKGTDVDLRDLRPEHRVAKLTNSRECV